MSAINAIAVALLCVGCARSEAALKPFGEHIGSVGVNGVFIIKDAATGCDYIVVASMDAVAITPRLYQGGRYCSRLHPAEEQRD